MTSNAAGPLAHGVTTMIRGRMAVVAMLLLALPALAFAGQVRSTADLVAAWTDSLAKEAGGDLVGARATIVAAYGPMPDAYAPCVRLAWLNLQLRDGQHAAELYRRARQLPGALPEATDGLVSALVQSGYSSLGRGNLPEARRVWREAQRLDLTRHDAEAGLALVGGSTDAALELWGGSLGLTGSASATVVYGQIPVRVNDHISVRGAFRRVGASASTTTTDAFSTQTEAFGGVSVEQGITATEVMLFRLHNAFDDTTGLALNTRVGGHAGLTVMIAGQHSSSGWNSQLMPQAFVWVHPSVALAAGVRVTSDPTAGSSRSFVGGVTLVHRHVEFDVQAHTGTERSSFSMAGPTILSFVSSTTRGAVSTLSVGTGSSAAIFGQLQLERLESGAGRYSSVAFGVRINLARRH